MNNIFIKKIEIIKVRHLRDITIDLSDEKRHLILTGKNGSGKTSVLDFIDTNLDLTQVLISSDEQALTEEIRNSLKVILNDEPYNVPFDPKNRLLLSPLQRLYSKNQFLYYYFNAKRSFSTKQPSTIEKIDPKDIRPPSSYDSRDRRNKLFLQFIVNLRAAQSFSSEEGKSEEVSKIKKWFDNFEDILKEIFTDSDLKLEFDFNNFNFIIHTKGREAFDFHTLPDGYGSIMDIITEIILQMEYSETQGYDGNGIVLIDEIEAHLHLELQKNILPFLTKLFPGIQFIVTTHSPFILNSIPDAIVYDLETNACFNSSDLTGIAYEGVVESYFNIDRYSKEIKEKLDRYKNIIKKADPSEDELSEKTDLRIYLKQIPSWLAPEIKIEFDSIVDFLLR